MGACESNRHLVDDGVMMLRVLALSLTLFTGFAQATVLQRPITLDTGTGELFGSLLLPKSDNAGAGCADHFRLRPYGS